MASWTSIVVRLDRGLFISPCVFPGAFSACPGSGRSRPTLVLRNWLCITARPSPVALRYQANAIWRSSGPFDCGTLLCGRGLRLSTAFLQTHCMDGLERRQATGLDLFPSRSGHSRLFLIGVHHLCRVRRRSPHCPPAEGISHHETAA